MIAFLLVKDVDERLAAAGERVFTPQDALSAAMELFQWGEYHKLTPRLRERVGIDVELPRWEDASPDTQWAYMHRALEALQQAELQRRAPAVTDSPDPAQPAGESL